MSLAQHLISGDCRQVLPTMPSNLVDAIVTRPPGIPDPEIWRQALRILKPGCYLLAISASNTFHRLACSLEDIGLEIRDTLCWLYSPEVADHEPCFTPAWQPIILACKPGPNVLPLGIDACRIPTGERLWQGGCKPGYYPDDAYELGNRKSEQHPAGRWPANVVHDGSEGVEEAFAAFGEKKGDPPDRKPRRMSAVKFGWKGQATRDAITLGFTDQGTVSRYFYSARMPELLRWLVRLICRRGGLVLDPFSGNGSIMIACSLEGRSCIGIEPSQVSNASAQDNLAHLRHLKDNP